MFTSTISPFNISLLWFGTAISIAEIMTGTLLAPLGMTYGFCAIFLGHLIGGIILFLTGFIGAKCRLSSFEIINSFFGRLGATAFSILNIIQLIGWITIMLIISNEAINHFTDMLWQLLPHDFLWIIVLGLVPCIWIFCRGKFINHFNRLIILCLFLVSLWLAFNSVFTENPIIPSAISNNISFGLAVELNVAMCISWMPVISDYTCKLTKHTKGTLYAVFAYCFGSCLMYIIGLSSAIHFNTTDICDIFALSGLGIIALLVILLSTITTNFIAINSATLCFTNLFHRFNFKITFICICLFSIFLAYFVSMQQYENFLYFIGAIFAPLFAISFSEFFIFHNTKIHSDKIIIKNNLLWLVGFIIYENLIDCTTFIGITFPVMLGIAICNIIISYILNQTAFSLKKS